MALLCIFYAKCLVDWENSCNFAENRYEQQLFQHLECRE